MHAEPLPLGICVPSLVWIARAVFLLERGHADTHIHTKSQTPLMTLLLAGQTRAGPGTVYLGASWRISMLGGDAHCR